MKRAGEEELPDGTRSAFYVFTHSLHREVLYQRQTPARRSVRHRRVATRLRNLFRGREELIARDAASHYEAAGDRPEAIVMLRLAARRAITIKAYSEAAELHEWIARLSAELAPHERRTAADTGDERTWPCEFGSAANSTSRSAKA